MTQKNHRAPHKTIVKSLVALVLVAVAALVVVPRATANPSDEIEQLRQENARNNSIVADLKNTAVSYQNAIEQLQAQINDVQAKINYNTARQNEIQANITANEAELARQKSVLGENIRVMYVEGQISTIEMLATSKNLSEFVDKEEYRTAVKNKIQATLVRIADLQKQLKEQKVQIDRLLAEQQQQRNVLANARAEQARMLAFNKAEQASYDAKTRTNQTRIDNLIAEQRRANNVTDGGYYFLRFPGTPGSFNPDAYPHKNAGFSMQLGPCSFTDKYPDSPDGWGYCTRQCVSYAAWAVGASGRSIPMYYGNAKDWVSAARNDDIPVFRSPEPGDIAISTGGRWGHAMYVERVEGNRMLVSQYNQAVDGEFSYQWRSF